MDLYNYFQDSFCPVRHLFFKVLDTLMDEQRDSLISASLKDYRIDFRINDIPISITKVMELYEKEYEQLIYDTARNILEERAGELLQKLDQINEIGKAVESEIKSKVFKILPEAITEEDYR